MVINYSDFLNEGLDTGKTTILYSTITALATFKPDLFYFLHAVKNRYTMSSNSLNELLKIELQKEERIKTTVESIEINIEEDWNKLKRCVQAAGEINKAFPIITEIQLTSFELVVITNHDRNVLKQKKTYLKESLLYRLLGFKDKDIYRTTSWEILVKKWIRLLNIHLKKPYSTYSESFNVNNWHEYRYKKHSSLGIKIVDLPKLYYNTLYDFSMDIIKKEDAFFNYETFIDQWKAFRANLLNEMFISLIKSLDMRTFHQLVDMAKGTEVITHYTFDKNTNLICIPAKDTATSLVNQKLLVNAKNELIVCYTSLTDCIKILLKTTSTCPSALKIKGKYEHA